MQGRKIVKENNRSSSLRGSSCSIYIYTRNIFWDYESRSMRSRRFRGGSGCWQRDSRSSMEVEAVKGKIGERGRMRTVKDEGAREGEESRAVVVVAIRWRRAKKWLIVTLSAICVLLPLQMTDPYRFCHGDIGATIAWKIAREIVERGKKKIKKKRRKFLPWRGGKMCRFFAFDRSESSIRLDSSLVILYFEQLT